MALNIKVEAIDAFARVSDESIRQGIMEIVANYHWRNGKQHNDGSRGEIRMSPKELRDLLAYMSLPDEAVEHPVIQGDISYETIDYGNGAGD